MKNFKLVIVQGTQVVEVKALDNQLNPLVIEQGEIVGTEMSQGVFVKFDDEDELYELKAILEFYQSCFDTSEVRFDV
jgi:hypothetical protein